MDLQERYSRTVYSCCDDLVVAEDDEIVIVGELKNVTQEPSTVVVMIWL